MSIGPIQAFVIGFPDNDLLEGRIAEELARLSDVGQIRIIDAVFVLREEGELSDLAPTILTLLGLPVPSDMTGNPLATAP